MERTGCGVVMPMEITVAWKKSVTIFSVRPMPTGRLPTYRLQTRIRVSTRQRRTRQGAGRAMERGTHRRAWRVSCGFCAVICAASIACIAAGSMPATHEQNQHETVDGISDEPEHGTAPGAGAAGAAGIALKPPPAAMETQEGDEQTTTSPMHTLTSREQRGRHATADGRERVLHGGRVEQRVLDRRARATRRAVHNTTR